MARIKLCERCGGRLPDGGGSMLAVRDANWEVVAVALLCSTCWDAAGDGVNRTAAQWIAWVDAGAAGDVAPALAAGDAPAGSAGDAAPAPAAHGFALDGDKAAAGRWFAMSARERRALVGDKAECAALNRALWRRLSVREKRNYLECGDPRASLGAG